VHVALVDPAAFTPPYDHRLAAALAAEGVDVELLTSRFRFGAEPEVDGFRRTHFFYPYSSRLRTRSPLRLPLRAAEHLVALRRLRGVSADVVHHQWVAAPELDVRLLPLGAPAVLTAHDILPRRTARKLDLWKRVYARFDAVVVHSEHGAGRLMAELGVDPERIRIIPHPVFPGRVRAEDDGRTVVALGNIRPYKQLGHSIKAAERAGARMVVAGDAAMDVSEWQARPGIEWHLGYLDDGALDNVLAASTVALFPYTQELDQSGALLRALGSGVPVVAYDVGGIAEPVRRFGAGTVVPPDDLDALAEATRNLLDDPDALVAAQAGALHAARELTWEASARAHVDLYRSLLG
jgi:glycosyltransferase involved in cell wall biosynthesis